MSCSCWFGTCGKGRGGMKIKHITRTMCLVGRDPRVVSEMGHNSAANHKQSCMVLVTCSSSE